MANNDEWLADHDRELIERHSRLYAAIADAYEEEQDDDAATAKERHINGVMAAVKAIYLMGNSEGYCQGYWDGAKDRIVNPPIQPEK